MLSLVAFVSNAQFKIIAKSGTVSYVDGRKKINAVTGTTVKQGTMLVVSPNSFVGLLHTSGKTYQINKAGTYHVSDLESKLTKTESNFSSKYSTFVYDGLYGGNNSSRKSTGSVERDVDKSDIKLFYPKMFNTTDSVIVLNWKDLDMGKYVITIKDVFDEVIVKEVIDTNMFEYNFDAYQHGNDEQSITWSISLEKDTTFASKVVSVTYTTVDELGGFETSALDYLVRAKYYADKLLFLDALNAYKKAISLDPDNTFYKEEYDSYLKSLNL